MIRIAQAACPESRKGKWGVPPNQLRTGATKTNPGGNLDGELNIIPFYGGWEKVFRCIDSQIADKIAWIMERIVANGKYIGYGQNNGQYPRTLVFDALNQMSKPDPLEIKALCNCDCSSSAGASVYHAGIYEPKLRDMWTGTARKILLGTGKFVEITDQTLLQSAQGIRRGDLLWKDGHMAIALDTDTKQELIPCVTYNCLACNLRQGPGTEYKVIESLAGGVRVDLVSRAENGWGQMKVGQIYGYISPKYYKALPQMTATGNVWMRSGAGTSYNKIIVIPQGAKPYATGKTKKVNLTTWYECIYAGREGWASGKYLR